MATTNNLTTTYAGEFAGKYISAALLSGDTLGNELITIKPNVKHKEVLKKVATDSLVKDATCDFDPTSTLTLTERILTMEEFQVNLQLCKKDFVTDWEAVQMGYSAYSNLPPSLSDFLIAHVADKTAQKMEQNIWGGSNSNAGEFDGLVTLALADSSVVDVASHAAVTSANVIAKLGSIVDAIPSTLYGSESLKIYVSQNIAKAYVRALGGFVATIGANGTDNKGTQWYANGALSFDGIPVVVANGLNDDTAMAAESTNLFFGCGLLSDVNQEVKYIDMSEIDGSQNSRIIMRMSAGVQYAIGSDIVLYHA